MKCGDCIWWSASDLQHVDQPTEASCRRHAPRLLLLERTGAFGARMESGRTAWPQTLKDDYCGEFKERATCSR